MKKLIRVIVRGGRRAKSEKGIATMEMALVFPILLMLAVGAAEIGFAMVDWLAVSNATREGARVGSAAGDSSVADVSILAAVDEALTSLDGSTVSKVEVFKADIDGSALDAVNLLNEYVPDGSGGWLCANNCPWTPASRNVSASSLDRLAVRISFTHNWVTGLMPLGPGTWSDDTVMRLEPAVAP